MENETVSRMCEVSLDFVGAQGVLMRNWVDMRTGTSEFTKSTNLICRIAQFSLDKLLTKIGFNVWR
jgi:hypothetical protein